jgi:glycosyltransferase involved in cell wall biosynthesis
VPTHSGRIRVCFFAPYLWPSFSDGRIEFAGGAERQQAVIARGLAARNFDVSVATCDFGQGRRVVKDGITFHATHPPFAGLPLLRFFHPRLTGNLRALFAAQADVFYARGAGFPAGIASDVARVTRAAFVFAGAHDTDAQAALPLVPNPRDRWWAARAIRGADAIIAQTRTQQGLFRDTWQRDSTVIPNLVELPQVTLDAGQGNAVLWISTYKDSKRPEWVVELARRMPSVRFRMAGVIPPPPLPATVYDRVRDAARALPNLEVQGHLDHRDLAAFLSSGGVFLHTSPLEGFPNTMLESWAHGVPTISMVDPDGMVARDDLGEVVKDLSSMEQAVAHWIADPERRHAAGVRARAAMERDHSPAAIVERIAGVLASAAQKARRKPG